MATKTDVKPKGFYELTAEKIAKSLAANAQVATVTKVVRSGQRTPLAEFKVVTEEGEILAITVKRISA